VRERVCVGTGYICASPALIGKEFERDFEPAPLWCPVQVESSLQFRLYQVSILRSYVSEV